MLFYRKFKKMCSKHAAVFREIRSNYSSEMEEIAKYKFLSIYFRKYFP